MSRVARWLFSFDRWDVLGGALALALDPLCGWNVTCWQWWVVMVPAVVLITWMQQHCDPESIGRA